MLDIGSRVRYIGRTTYLKDKEGELMRQTGSTGTTFKWAYVLFDGDVAQSVVNYRDIAEVISE